MSDLTSVLPDFPIRQYANLLVAIEKHQLTTCELLSLEVTELGKRTGLPLLDLKRLCNAVLDALHADLGVSEKPPEGGHTPSSSGRLQQTVTELVNQWSTISTLDDTLDRALGGGVPTGHVTEITGESGAGKTQFLLTLLLSVQLPAPHGMGRPALYISTEAPLSTKRLMQMLRNNRFFESLDPSCRPSLDNILSIVTSDLESQDQILTFQAPVEIERRNIGLLILDSVAANYRAEFERGSRDNASSGSNLAARSAALVRLGWHLHQLAKKYNIAVVVANQVADRFSKDGGGLGFRQTPGVPKSSQSGGLWRGDRGTVVPSQESPLASRSRNKYAAGAGAFPPTGSVPSSNNNNDEWAQLSSMPEPIPEDGPPAPPVLLLDHQQRWFTGWGDDPYGSGGTGQEKTPSLGLVWSTQITSRIALLRRQTRGPTAPGASAWRRWMKVAFAPHVAPSGPGVRRRHRRRRQHRRVVEDGHEDDGEEADAEEAKDDDEDGAAADDDDVTGDGAVEFEVTMGGLRAV